MKRTKDSWKRWSKEEDKILKYYWNKAEPSEWVHILPNRTYYSIKTRSRKLGITRDLTKFSKKKTFSCIICNKTFKGYGNKILCSRKCIAKYFSKTRLGENNPAYKEKTKKQCLNCGLEFEYSREGLHKKQERYYCSIKCHNEYVKGKEQHLKLNNETYRPYVKEWTRELKDNIKLRDNNLCVFCGGKEKLEVHHIDYNIWNCEEDNLITLCKSCHSKTNHNNIFWQHIFEFIMSGYEIRKKGWGFEFIPVSNNHYCLKALVFFKHKQFSNHFHEIKKESWYCLYGKMYAKLTLPSNEIKEFIYKKGEVLDISQREIHQLKALDYTILLEVSTKDDKTDSYRISSGDSL